MYACITILITKHKGTHIFHFLFYLKHIKDMESNSIWVVISTCSDTYMSPVRQTRDTKVYPCSRNLLPFCLKCNTKFLEKYKGSYIFSSAYICHRVKKIPICLSRESIRCRILIKLRSQLDVESL